MLTGRVGEMLAGFACTLIGVILVLPIPFANLLPSWSLGAFSLGLTRRDGACILAGYVLLAAALGVIALAYALLGRPFAASFSTSPAVVGAVLRYIGWAVLMPVVGVTSFVFDGVFIGSSWTRAMLVSMAIALAGFLLMLWLARGAGNDGLWLAFSLFFVLRAVAQAILAPGLMRRSFGSLATSTP